MSFSVSVVTPTFNREQFLPGLYDAFAAQTAAPLELLIADDSPAPSHFCATIGDPRVRYLHMPQRTTIGAKRNQLVEAARGDVIVFFDDDDHYAPGYIDTMLEALGDADFVKLTAWYLASSADGELFYWDTTVNHAVHHKVGGGDVGIALGEQFPADFVARNRDGYGFSYVFRRALFERAHFPARNFGEDFAFLTDARASGAVVRGLADPGASVVHVLHPRSTSVAYPQYRLPASASPRLFPGLADHLRRAFAR